MDKTHNPINKAAEKINSNLKGDLGKFLYKIFNDMLALLLVIYALLLVSEGVIPGLASAHLSFTRLTLIVFAVLGMIIYLGKINGISFEFGNKKTALVGGLMAFSILLIINSLLKFALWEIGIITIASFALLFYFHNNFFKNN